MEKSKAKVNTPSDLYLERQADRDMTAALYGGTGIMRKAGTKYLPHFPGEDNNQYTTRLETSFLYPGFQKTIDTMTGRVFRKDPIVEIPSSFLPFMDNIDLIGTNFPMFAMNSFIEVLKDGINFIHLDYVKMPTEKELGRKLTREDDKKYGARPFLRMIKAESVIDWNSTTIGGNVVLTSIRILETDSKPDGWGKTITPQVRVIYLDENFNVMWKIYRESTDKKNEWIVVEEGTIEGINFIPIFPIYANSKSFFDALPPLLDLAYLNIEHWQSASDQRNILHTARVPILAKFGSVEDDGEETEISSKTMFEFRDSNSDMKYVEHSGASIQAGERDSTRLKEEMATIGVELLIKTQGFAQKKTATEVNKQDEESTSTLGSYSKSAADGFQTVFKAMAIWEKQSSEKITVKFNDDFGAVVDDGKILDTLDKGRDRRDITQRSWLKRMKELGVLGENFDVENEIEASELDIRI